MELSVDWISLGPALTVLFVLLVLDIIGGFLVAAIKKELTSTMSYAGLLKKVGILVYVALGMCFDLLMVNYQDQLGMGDFKPPLTAATLVALWYVYHESLSVVEKVKKSGMPLPPILSHILDRLKRSTDGGGVSFGNVNIGHVSAHDVKVESDHNLPPATKLETQEEVTVVDKVAGRRAAREQGAIEK